MTWQYGIKVVITALLVVAISEAAKRWSLMGAVLASLPVTSMLAMIWLYVDTQDLAKINELSMGIFWMVIPSLAFFLLLPFFHKQGLNFWLSMLVASSLTAALYWGYITVLPKLGVKL